MDFFIKKNSTLPVLKFQVVKDGRSDYNNFMKTIELSSIFFSMVDVETGIPKITSRPGGFVEKTSMDPNAEPEYYIYYQFTSKDTNRVGRYEGEFMLRNSDGVLILPIREKLNINVQESFIANDLVYNSCYVSEFPCCVNESTSTPTPTPTPTPTSTPTETPTETPTPTPTETPTSTPTETPTETPTPTPTETPTQTPTSTPTETPTETPTPTPTETPTQTPTPTNSETPTQTPTPTNSETPTNTPTNTETPTPTQTPTNSETPTNTPTNTPTITPTNLYTIGQAALGGIIAYILESGDPGYDANVQKGLVATTSDVSTGATWGCYGEAISGADGTSIGTGYQNTIDIISGCTDDGIAAKLCRDLNEGGYSDWFLPSTDELYKLYLNRVVIGGFVSSFYWSSTESTSIYSYVINFFDGTTGSNNRLGNDPVRAVRYF